MLNDVIKIILVEPDLNSDNLTPEPMLAYKRYTVHSIPLYGCT